MIQINLLPWRERKRQLKRSMFGILLGAFFVLGLFIIFLIHINMSSAVSLQMRRNEFLQTQINNAQDEFTSLKQKKEEQIKLLASLKFILELRNESYEAVRLLDVLAASTPSSIIMEKIVRDISTVTISGTAPTDSDVTTLMKNISTHENSFGQAVLTEISSQETATSTVRHFTIKIDEKI